MKSIKIIRLYYKLTGVKPVFIVLEFITLLIPALTAIYSTVLAANVITALTVYDFSGAIKQLSIEFALIVVSAISYFIYHILSKKVNKIIAINLNEFVYKNIRQNNNISKISLSTLNDITKCVDFNKALLYKLCFFIKSIIILCIVLYYSWIVGLGLIAVSLIMGVILKFTDRQIQLNEQEYSDYQATSLDLFNSIQKGSKLEENQNLEQRLKDKYFTMVSNGAKTKNKIALFYNINNNFVSLVLKSAVFGFTIYLIMLVKSTTLTLSLYLILTPYLTSSAQNLLEFFELFSEIGLIDNIISKFEALRFQTEQKTENVKDFDFDTFNLYFYHTTLKEPNEQKITQEIENNTHKNKKDQKVSREIIPKTQQETKQEIIDINLKIEFGDSVAFVGESGSGKRAIFKLLSREKISTEGSIFLDYKNIAEIQPDKYKSIVACTTKRSYFYNISIIENLHLVCESNTKINTAIRNFGLKSEIDKLPDKMNTVVDENFSPKLIYFLGLVRAYVSGAKIICIYESPENFNRNDISKLHHIIKFLKGKCTIICFSHNDIFNNVVQKTYYVENSKIINANS